MERTAGSTASWSVIAALGLAALLQPIACGPTGSDDTGSLEGAAAIDALLASVGPEVVLPTLDRFRTEVADLDAALVAWQDAQGTASEAQAKADAQQAWVEAWVVWQELEVMQVGPAASSLTAPGGEDLRDSIYSWPVVNPCRVDQETVEANWDQAGFFDENLVNVTGLDSVEHLLFAGPDNACPGQIDINAEGTWDALGAAGVEANRADYALALTAEVDAVAATLEQAWDPAGGDYSATLAAADSPYAGPQDALNSVYDALFYLETRTKDRKLAQPLGLRDCGTATCPQDVEAIASGEGVAAVRANLVGFDTLCHGDLAGRIDSNLDAAIAATDAVDGPLDEAIASDTADVQALHDAVKRLTDDLKGDLATLLALQVPAEAAGDND